MIKHFVFGLLAGIAFIVVSILWLTNLGMMVLHAVSLPIGIVMSAWGAANLYITARIYLFNMQAVLALISAQQEIDKYLEMMRVRQEHVNAEIAIEEKKLQTMYDDLAKRYAGRAVQSNDDLKKELR